MTRKRRGKKTPCLEFNSTNVAFGYLLDRQPNTLVFLPFLICSKRKKNKKQNKNLVYVGHGSANLGPLFRDLIYWNWTLFLSLDLRFFQEIDCQIRASRIPDSCLHVQAYELCTVEPNHLQTSHKPSMFQREMCLS